MILTTPAERAHQDLNTLLSPLRDRRERVIAVVKKTVDQVSAAKSWRNPVQPANDARAAYKALEDFRDTIGQLELSLAISGGANPVVAKALEGLRINHYGKELNAAPLLRVLGQEQDFLKAEKRLARLNSLFGQKFDTVFKLARRDGSNALAVVSAYPPAIDHERRAARFVISTPSMDREGEIIEPLGIDQTDYIRNAVVLWNHGLDTVGDLPLAKSVRANGSPGVDISEQGVTAWAEFSFHPFAEQVWQMILRGEINAASIGAVPVRSEQRWIDGRLIPTYTASKLLEWSIVAIPCNPEAVLRSLGKREQDKAEIEGAWAKKWQDKVMKAVEGKVAKVAEQVAAQLVKQREGHNA